MTRRALRVLIVDDDPSALTAAGRALREHSTATACDVEQAIATLHREPFDVVVSDVAELLAYVSRSFGGVYRILMTRSDPARVEVLRTTGVADLVLDKAALRQLTWVCATIGGTRR